MTFVASTRFLRVFNNQPVDRTPVWLMRQAGRYLPEYRRVRAGVKDFIELCRTPELAAEVTLQPLRRYPLDAAILFQDILTLPHAMGAPLAFVEQHGPVFEQPIQSHQAIDTLKDIDATDVAFVQQEIRLIQQELSAKIPLIGFCGSPWTVACYMVEGKLSKQFSDIRRMMIEAPDILHALLQKLTDNTITYLKAQVDAGVQCLMIFDTWGGILPYQAFNDCSLHYMRTIVDAVKPLGVPVIVFSKQAAHRYQDIATIGAQGMGTDWTLPLSHVRKVVGNDIVLQGNLDPFVLFGNKQTIRDAVATLLEDAAGDPRHIFNLGHGMMPQMDPESVDTLLDALHSLCPQYYPNSTQLQEECAGE